MVPLSIAWFQRQLLRLAKDIEAVAGSNSPTADDEEHAAGTSVGLHLRSIVDAGFLADYPEIEARVRLTLPTDAALQLKLKTSPYYVYLDVCGKILPELAPNLYPPSAEYWERLARGRHECEGYYELMEKAQIADVPRRAKSCEVLAGILSRAEGTTQLLAIEQSGRTLEAQEPRPRKQRTSKNAALVAFAKTRVDAGDTYGCIAAKWNSSHPGEGHDENTVRMALKRSEKTNKTELVR